MNVPEANDKEIMLIYEKGTMINYRHRKKSPSFGDYLCESLCCVNRKKDQQKKFDVS